MKAVFYPRNEVTGLTRRFGVFYISTDNFEQEIAVKLSIPAGNLADRKSYFASILMYHDGIALMRKLDKRGFIAEFERLQADTFYDVLQCLHVADIPLLCHDDDPQMMSRRVYETIHG